MNILYNLMPGELRAEAYGYLDHNHSGERKPDQTVPAALESIHQQNQ